jgi:hypothetical protein
MSLRRTLAGLLFPLCLVGVAPALAGEVVYACGDLPVRAKLSGFGIEVYQGDDGWFFRKNELNHTFPMSDRSARFLQRLDAVLKMHDVQLVLMPLPTKSMLDAEHAAVASSANNIIFDPAYARAQFEQRLQSFRGLGLPVVDVLAEVDGAEKVESGYFFAQDLHWRPELARASARASAVALEATFPGEFPGTRSFVTRLKSSGAQVHSANSRPLLNQLCGSAVEAEMVPVYETVEADQSVDAFLGDDSGVPPVSVIGTSFTDESLVYNFSGFLREALQADVASYALAGGNIDQSLFKWAHTGQASSGTRALLWEMPYLDRLEAAATTLERTVVPAIAGSCEGTDNEIFATEYTLKDTAPFTLPVPADVAVSGDDFYVTMGLSDAAARGFTFTFEYRDGKRDVLPVVREARVGAIDRVYAELAPDLPAELGAISFRAMQSGSNAGRIALCRYPTAMPKGAQSGGPDGDVVLTTAQEVKK